MRILKATLLGALLCSFLTANAQDTGVAKSIFNVQTGPIGLWVSNEARLANTFALRTEIGLDLWIYESNYDRSGAVLAPSIKVEPRWYYNIEKRAAKGKYTANNSANAITIAVKYTPDLLIGGHPDYVNLPNELSITPKWIMRRTIAKSNFNYELGGGIGYVTYLTESDIRMNDGADVLVDIHARIGYTF
ncbi:MAG: hypothetical protein EOO45_22355 [Flavobacterium sp.]|nr:MAG: hypothetical protein EOO45_22355 [Flavobacterium sp.]